MQRRADPLDTGAKLFAHDVNWRSDEGGFEESASESAGKGAAPPPAAGGGCVARLKPLKQPGDHSVVELWELMSVSRVQ